MVWSGFREVNWNRNGVQRVVFNVSIIICYYRLFHILSWALFVYDKSVN